MELYKQFIDIFDALRGGDNDIVAQATSEAEELFRLPDSIYVLIQIIREEKNLTYKLYGSVFLGKSISALSKMEILEDPISIIEQCLDIVSKETNEETQRLTISALERIIKKDSEHMIIEFAQVALNEGRPSLLHAAFLLCKIIISEVDQLNEKLSFFIELINAGIEKLSSPLRPIEFAFILGELIDDENEPFFSQIWEDSINYVCEKIDEIDTVKFITYQLNDYMNGDIPYFVNPNSILEKFLPLFGDEDIDFEVNKCLLLSITAAIDIEGVLDGIDYEEFFPSTLEKMIQVSAMAYNPDDLLSISEVNIFEDFCVPFSSPELDTCDLFIDSVLSLIDEYYPQAETKPGIIIALGYVIGEGTDIIIDSLQKICQLLIESVNDECRLVRSSSAFAINELVTSLENEIEDYIEYLGNAMLQSLELDVTQDMIIAFENFLISAMDTDPIFDDAYNFLMEKMSDANEVTIQYYFPCLTELCIKSKNKVRDVFEQLVPIIFDSIEQNFEISFEKAVLCLSQMSISMPELFAPYVQQLLDLVDTTMKSEDQSFLTPCLLSFGKLVKNFAEQIDPYLEQLVPKLLQIGSEDLSAEFIKEVAEHDEKLKTLEDEGEVEFNVDDDDDDKETVSEYGVPALALSILSAILISFPEHINDVLGNFMEDLSIQMKNANADAVDYTFQAIYYLTQAISKSELPPETKSEVACQFCQWSISLINNSNVSISSAGNAMKNVAHVIELFGIKSIGDENLEEIISIIRNVLDGKLKCQEDIKEYIKELHDELCELVTHLIASLGQEAPEVLAPVIPMFFDLATSRKNQFRDIALQVLGQLVEHSSDNLSKDDKENIYRFVINGIRKDSQHAAFALNQFTNQNGDIIMQNIEDLMSLILEKLDPSNKKKASSYIAFIDNLVAAVGEIRRNVLGDDFPLEDFASICLSNMPAAHDITTNLDMMNFFVWMAEKLNMNPVDEFATVAIRLFMVPKIDSEIGGIAEDDSEILQKVAFIMVSCLNEMGQNADTLIQSICEDDQIKIQRVHDVINSVQ